MSFLRRRGDDERGAVFVLLAVAMVALIGSAALAVDIGQLTNTRRDLQAVADAIALDTARAINGTTVAELSAPTGPVTVAAQNSATRNDFPFAQLEVHLGTKSAGADFVRSTDPAAVPNAVEIVARGTVDYAFSPTSSDTSRRAVGTQHAVAGFSVGSYLVGLSAQHNTVLNAIFGDAFDINVLSYNGLVDANVTLEAIGLEWPMGVLTPDEVLTTDLSLSEFMVASADVLRNQGETVAADVLDAMRLSMTADTMINLEDAVIAQTGASEAAATAELNLLQMLTTMAFVADGDHAVTIPATQLAIPGVGDVTMSLEVIEPAQTAFGPVGTTAETAQVRLTLTPQLTLSTSAEVNACSLQGTLGALLSLNLSQVLTCTLGGFVGRLVSLDLNASVPIAVEAAGATGTLSAISCNAPESITVDLEPQPLTLTSNVDLTFTGTLLGNPLGDVLRVSATGGTTVASPAVSEIFLHPSEFNIPRSTGSSVLGLAGLTNLTSTNATLLNADLGPVLNTLTTPVLNVVNATLGQLESVLVSPLSQLLGLNLGGADVTALAMECLGVRLAE